MNNTILAAKDSTLLENLIVKYGKIVTSVQIEAEANSTWQYQQIHNRIQQLVKNGWLLRIKRGLYAIADLSTRGFLSISPYVIANLLVEESCVSFEAALAFRGMFDQFTDQFTSLSLKQYKTTDLNSIRYRFIKTRQKMFIGWELVEIENLEARIAYAEKALVDMICFNKSKYAVDLVIEKLQNFQSDLDFQKLFDFSRQASKKTVKVFGWMLDLLGLDSSRFFNLIANDRGTHWLNRGDTRFSAKWRLYTDEYFEKFHTERKV